MKRVVFTLLAFSFAVMAEDKAVTVPNADAIKLSQKLTVQKSIRELQLMKASARNMQMDLQQQLLQIPKVIELQAQINYLTEEQKKISEKIDTAIADAGKAQGCRVDQNTLECVPAPQAATVKK